MVPGVHEPSAQIKRALEGDRSAQNRLVTELGGLVRAVARHQLAQSQACNEQTVDDVSQNTWLGLFAPPKPRLGLWRPGGMSLASFVGQAARWQARMYLRGQRADRRDRRREVPVREDLADPREFERQVVARQTAGLLAEHISKTLPARGCLIFRLLYEDGLEISEVADRLEVNKQVVYNWKHRIRECARTFAESHDRTPPP